MRTITSEQNDLRRLDGVTMVWFVVGTFDDFGLADVVKRYASAAVTVSGVDYDDTLSPGGLSLGATQLRADGGISQVAGFNVTIRDEEEESEVSGSLVISNDEVIVYLVLWDGTQDSTDLVEIARGVVERDWTSGSEWQWQVKDGSKQDFRVLPFATLDPTTYPWAWSLGLPIPECFGMMNVGPHDGAGIYPSLAPMHFTDKFQLKATSSLHRHSAGTVYQWYPTAKRFAELVTVSESGGITTVSDPARLMRLQPVRPKTGTNDVANWYLAADGNNATKVTVPINDNLDLWFAGSPKLGVMTSLAVKIVVETSGPTYTVTIKDDTTTIDGPTDYTNDATIALDPVTYEAWDLELLNIELKAKTLGGGGETIQIREIYLLVGFNDFLFSLQDEPQMYQKTEGWNDLAAYYRDGAVVYSSDTPLRNPAHVLAAILRGSTLTNLATAKVDATSFADAANSRSTWSLDFWFDHRRQVSEEYVDRLCFDTGLYLLKQGGSWRCAARDKERAPQHFILGDYHCPVLRHQLVPPQEYDFQTRPADASLIYNEIAIRYLKHPATGEYLRSYVASGQYRLTGVCYMTSGNGALNAPAVDFVAAGVIAADDDIGTPGERVYVSGDTTYEVTAVDSVHVLFVRAIDGGPVSDLSGKDFWLGPNLHGDAFLSQQSYKVVNALGGTRQQSFLEDAGYETDFVRDDDTAEEMGLYFLEWSAVPRDRIAFPVYHDLLKLQEGDVFLLDHERLFANRQAQSVTLLDSDVNASTTSWPVTFGQAGRFRVGDHIYVQTGAGAEPECVVITDINGTTSTLTVTRGQLGTRGLAHDEGDAVIRPIVKWICTGLRPPTPEEPVFRVEAEQMPRTYYPTGIVVATGYPDWAGATTDERYAAGWATGRTGRVSDGDRDSAISYVGIDTGTYTIT